MGGRRLRLAVLCLMVLGGGTWLARPQVAAFLTPSRQAAIEDAVRASPAGRLMPPPPTNPAGPVCDPRRPIFVHGFAELKARLGDAMGEPLECEQPIHVNGDTRQRTTTGYAYYRSGPNTPAFTNEPRGKDHWALTSQGLVYWAGDMLDPPINATPGSAR